MLLSNAIRAILIAAIPLLTLKHWISLSLLDVITFGMGIFSVLFELCWYSFLPSLVSKKDLIEANGKISASSSAGQVAGSGLVGFLVTWFTAPMVLFFDSASYVVSVVSLLLITRQEPLPVRKQRIPWFKEVGEGLQFTFRNTYLRTTALLGAGWNMCEYALTTIFLLYAVHQLHFSPYQFSLIYAVGLTGGIMGSACASALARYFRLGAILVGSYGLGALSLILIPLAGGSPAVILALCMIAFFVMRTGEAVWNVLKLSLRQAITPAHMQSRTYACLWVVAYSGSALGPLIAGLLGSTIGLRSTLWIASSGFVLLMFLCFFSPLRSLQALPVSSADQEAAS